MAKPTIYTVGHSDLSIGDFIKELHANAITLVVDVRKLTGSNRFPWFDENRLTKELGAVDIKYTQIHALSGRRPRDYSISPHVNGAWENQSFHNYADYATTPAFGAGLRKLEVLARLHTVTTMCSEAVWWRCHRRIITDHLLAQGYPVKNIMSATQTTPATLTPGAKVAHGSVTYPGPHGSTTVAPHKEATK